MRSDSIRPPLHGGGGVCRTPPPPSGLKRPPVTNYFWGVFPAFRRGHSLEKPCNTAYIPKTGRGVSGIPPLPFGFQIVHTPPPAWTLVRRDPPIESSENILVRRAFPSCGEKSVCGGGCPGYPPYPPLLLCRPGSGARVPPLTEGRGSNPPWHGRGGYLSCFRYHNLPEKRVSVGISRRSSALVPAKPEGWVPLRVMEGGQGSHPAAGKMVGRGWVLLREG